MYVTLVFPDSAPASRVFVPDAAAGALLPFITKLAAAKGLTVDTSTTDDDGSTEKNVYDAAGANVWVNGVSLREAQRTTSTSTFSVGADGAPRPARITDPAPRRGASILGGVLAAAVAGSLAAPPLAMAAVGAFVGFGVYQGMKLARPKRRRGAHSHRTR